MRPLSYTLLVVLLGFGAGCAQQGGRISQQVVSPGYFVPTAAIVQKVGCETPALASEVLPASDGEIWFARGEKTAWGNTPIAEFASYSIYTSDAQAIGNPRFGYGYRYRWMMQAGLALPSQ